MTKTKILLLTLSTASIIGVITLLILMIKKSYFTIQELCYSETAEKYNIDNTPTPEARENLKALINEVLNPTRKAFGAKITVNSGYRCPELNKKVGGEASSQHLKGEAADITAGSIEKNRTLFKIIALHGVYDQLIWEKGGQWIHVSYKSSGMNRLAMLDYNGTSYKNINNNWENAIHA